MSSMRKAGRYCDKCKKTKPSSEFNRSKTTGFIEIRCKSCANEPVAKINIDRNLAAQFLGVKFDESVPNGYYTFEGDNTTKHYTKWSR